MARTKTAVTLVASTSNAAGATTRGRVDMNDCDGGFLTFRMTNGATGPTTQCTCNILVAHNSTLPAAGSIGPDWKAISTYGNGTTASADLSEGIPIDPAVQCLEVEFTGNTGQSVTVEAYLSKVAYS